MPIEKILIELSPVRLETEPWGPERGYVYFLQTNNYVCHDGHTNTDHYIYGVGYLRLQGIESLECLENKTETTEPNETFYGLHPFSGTCERLPKIEECIKVRHILGNKLSEQELVDLLKKKMEDKRNQEIQNHLGRGDYVKTGDKKD